jgi:hypothetical protein
VAAFLPFNVSFLFQCGWSFLLRTVLNRDSCRRSSKNAGEGEGHCYPFCDRTQVQPYIESGIRNLNIHSYVLLFPKITLNFGGFLLAVQIQILTMEWTAQLMRRIKNTMIC